MLKGGVLLKILTTATLKGGVGKTYQKLNLSKKIINKINKPIERETGISESFYLSKKVSNQLKELSKQTGKSKSYIVNSILEASLEEFL